MESAKRQACGPLSTSCSLFCDTKIVPRSVLRGAFSFVRHSRRKILYFRSETLQRRVCPSNENDNCGPKTESRSFPLLTFGFLMQQLRDALLHLPFLSAHRTSHCCHYHGFLYELKHGPPVCGGPSSGLQTLLKHKWYSQVQYWRKNYLHCLNRNRINSITVLQKDENTGVQHLRVYRKSIANAHFHA